jgi:iron complex transport system substrate-binding protein
MSGMSRGRFIGLVIAGIVVAAVVVAAILTQFGKSSSSTTSGPWTFTDDRGVTVSRESQPQRIVAYDLAASALMHIGLKPVGIFAAFPFDKNPQLAGFDLSGVAKVSEAYGDVNLETLAAAQPDLIVTIFDPRLTGPVIGFRDKATQEKVEQLAPIVAIDSTKDLTQVIERFEQLGSALGVDLKGQRVTAAHQRFEAASARLRAATAAKPDLTAAAVAAQPGLGLAYARPDLNPTLRLYQKLGLRMVQPEDEPADIKQNYNGFFYEMNSFELAGRYPADLILYSELPVAMDLKALEAVPTWQTLPAVKAGQLLPWRVLDPFSYELLSEDLENLANAVEHAKDVTGTP